ncbi:MAG: hypothetical protein IPM14_06510 [bacterium]|nr:hypothetical protein [bacterium]
MNTKIFFTGLSLLLMTFIVVSCTEDPTEPTEENTLLYTSFENNGRFSADGWTLPALSDSSSAVPSGGGNFSLVLEATEPPEVYAQITVPVKTQYNNFKLTFWSKSTAVTNNVYGKAILSLVRNGSIVQSSSVTVEDIIWQSYSIQDTFSVASGDSFLVQLSAGFSQLFAGKTYFDLCTLYGID